MSNLLQTSALWLAGQLKNAGGRAGVYVQGATKVNPITASPSGLLQEVMNESGVGTGVFICDFIFEAADLVLVGTPVIPREGDRFEETLNGISIAWEAAPKTITAPVYEWADSSGLLYIVHFKKAKL